MYDSPTTGRPLRQYSTSFPGPWNSPNRARTPFTKRINKSGKIYLTDSPGNGIREASQPFDMDHDPDLVTYAEWQDYRHSQRALKAHDNPDHEPDAPGDNGPNQLPTAKAKPIPRNTVAEAPNSDHGDSDDSGADGDYQLPIPKAKPITSYRADVAAHQHVSGPKGLTARQKSKRPQREYPLSDEGEDCPVVPPLRQGRLTKDITKLLESFGESTRRQGQELATLHGVNFATVMRLAGLGATTGSRASSEFNTFKSIYAAQIFADTGGKSKLAHDTCNH